MSPIAAATPEDSPPGDDRDRAMAKRVRRSYSRPELSLAHSFLGGPSPPKPGLSETSTPDPRAEKRQTLFGFEKLLAAGEADGPPTPDPSAARKPSGSAEGEAGLEPDPNIPGVSFLKERRRKKKVPQFNELELDEWVAQMNAEFDEAERFALLVE